MMEVIKINQSEKILMAAFNCISTKGYANVSLRDIANEADVVLSQLNYYYKNKEGLFTEVIKMMIKRYLKEFEKCLDAEQTSHNKVDFFVDFLKEILENNPNLFYLLYDFISLALWSPSFKKLLSDLFKDLSIVIENTILEDSPLKEYFKEYDINSLARMMLGVMLGTAIQVIVDPENESLFESLNVIKIAFND